MLKLDENELRIAFTVWANFYGHSEVNNSIYPFLTEEIKSPSIPQDGWLKSARKGLLLSTESVAKRLQINRITYLDFERREQNGTISLSALAKAADAIDCELVYAIRLKKKVPFSISIWRQILPHALQHPWLLRCNQSRRGAALAAIAKRLMKDSSFRREQGWTQRKEKAEAKPLPFQRF